MKKSRLIYLAVIMVPLLLFVLSFKGIYTEVEINAPPEDVWSILIDFEDYPNWNPFIVNITGESTEGSHINATIKPKGDDSMGFNPEILVSKPGNELRWIGRLLIPGIFDGEHYFKIEKISDSTIKFIHGENFKGILVLPLWGSLKDKTEKGFIAMNNALKEKAEKKFSGND